MGDARWAVSVGLVALCLGSVVVYNLTYTQYQGRFLFPVVSLISALTVLGVARATRSFVSARVRWIAVGAVVTALVAVDVASLFVLHDFFCTADQYA